VVIAQGYEAGGHNYQGRAGQRGLPTFVLLPALVDAVASHAMVLGSGGISDGRGVAAALDARKVRLVGAMYDVATGEVAFVEP